MPFVKTNQRSKAVGFQSHARVKLLPLELQEPEIRYLDFRDMYLQERSAKAQFEEALVQAKAERDRARIKEIGDRLHGIEANLTKCRQDMDNAATMSYAEAFLIVSRAMLGFEARTAIENATDKFLGRPEREVTHNK